MHIRENGKYTEWKRENNKQDSTKPVVTTVVVREGIGEKNKRGAMHYRENEKYTEWKREKNKQDSTN